MEIFVQIPKINPVKAAIFSPWKNFYAAYTNKTSPDENFLYHAKM